jgi:hypothetical protein
MNTDNILQELLRQKRSYESLLAMNSKVDPRSRTVV